MIKHAILITAYKDYFQLKHLIASLDNSFEIYIHIDKASNFKSSQYQSLLKINQVKIIRQKYRINWGGFNHLKAILLLCEHALQGNAERLHCITGSDFPVTSRKQINEIFLEYRESEFMEVFEVPKKTWPNNGGLDRLEYYNFNDLLNFKVPVQKRIIKTLIKVQKRIGYKRPPVKFKLFGGSTYWSLSRSCVQYVINFTSENKKFFKRFRFTLCAEEFYFQTIIMNSHFSENVQNDNLRYIDWKFRHGNNPAILDISDFNKIKNSNAIFARKMDNSISMELINEIKKNLL